jgi:hypothetical protein
VLFRVTLGRDEYLGTPAEVVAFLARGVGSPTREPAAYMRAVAARLGKERGLSNIPAHDPEAFLRALADHRIVTLDVQGEPSSERVSREEALGDGPVAFSEGVDPDEVDLD